MGPHQSPSRRCAASRLSRITRTSCTVASNTPVPCRRRRPHRESMRPAVAGCAGCLVPLRPAGLRATLPLLRLEHAAVYREGRPVIGTFDWRLVPGEHWHVCGPNGSGKSTFMSLLYGDLWPAHGGQLARLWPAVEDWKRATGLVSPDLQARYAATGCTVADIVASGLHDSIGSERLADAVGAPPRATRAACMAHRGAGRAPGARTFVRATAAGACRQGVHPAAPDLPARRAFRRTRCGGGPAPARATRCSACAAVRRSSW